MPFNYIQFQPNSSGLNVDFSELANGGNVVERQNLCISDSASAANIVSVVPKGTQSLYALTTQHLKDSGRTSICLSFTTGAVSSEALMSFYIAKAGLAQTSGNSSYTVTTGKTFRVQCINAWAYSAALSAALNIRSGPSAITIANSFVLLSLPMVPTAGWLTVSPAIIPDGFEIPSGTTIGLSQASYGSSVHFWGSLIGYEY
jgi:hypothetical protein